MSKNCPEATAIELDRRCLAIADWCQARSLRPYISAVGFMFKTKPLYSRAPCWRRVQASTYWTSVRRRAGKAVRAATMMKDTGTLVANELNGGRIVSLRRAFERMLITCAVVTHGNGIQYPMSDLKFDRVIADVPCTCEGTSRKQSLRSPRHSESFRSSINQTRRRSSGTH